jgi:hypothetical protein
MGIPKQKQQQTKKKKMMELKMLLPMDRAWLGFSRWGLRGKSKPSSCSLSLPYASSTTLFKFTEFI